MKNIARKLSALLLVFVVSMAALCPAFAASASLPSLPSGQCVVDDANVLSSSTVQTITDLNAQLESSCSGAQIGVLTVDYTGSCTTEEYALQAAKAWGIGSSTGNNGVLILLVMETQQYADALPISGFDHGRFGRYRSRVRAALFGRGPRGRGL